MYVLSARAFQFENVGNSFENRYGLGFKYEILPPRTVYVLVAHLTLHTTVLVPSNNFIEWISANEQVRYKIISNKWFLLTFYVNCERKKKKINYLLDGSWDRNIWNNFDLGPNPNTQLMLIEKYFNGILTSTSLAAVQIMSHHITPYHTIPYHITSYTLLLILHRESIKIA